MAQVYIASINVDIREDQIRQIFSAFGPIKSINMPYDDVAGVKFVAGNLIKFLL